MMHQPNNEKEGRITPWETTRLTMRSGRERDGSKGYKEERRRLKGDEHNGAAEDEMGEVA